MLLLFLVTSENTQQVEEEVDEVEIQCQGSDESQLLSTLAHIVLSLSIILIFWLSQAVRPTKMATPA